MDEQLLKEMGSLGITEQQLSEFEQKVKSVFVGENDFCGSLEFLLYLRVIQIKS